MMMTSSTRMSSTSTSTGPSGLKKIAENPSSSSPDKRTLATNKGRDHDVVVFALSISGCPAATQPAAPNHGALFPSLR